MRTTAKQRKSHQKRRFWMDPIYYWGYCCSFTRSIWWWVLFAFLGGRGRVRRGWVRLPKSADREIHSPINWRRGVRRRCETWHNLGNAGCTEFDGSSHVAGVRYFEFVEDEGSDDHQIIKFTNYLYML
jgi:hypothetical protein